MNIRIDRDSVHASDDGSLEDEAIAVEPTLTVVELLAHIRESRYLPGISGGKATWVVESSGNGGKPIGVVAQQWPEPRLIASSAGTLEEHFGSAAPSIQFKYWTQVDPELVFSRIESGEELPGRYVS